MLPAIPWKSAGVGAGGLVEIVPQAAMRIATTVARPGPAKRDGRTGRPHRVMPIERTSGGAAAPNRVLAADDFAISAREPAAWRRAAGKGCRPRLAPDPEAPPGSRSGSPSAPPPPLAGRAWRSHLRSREPQHR